MEKRPRRTVFVVKGESIKCECDRAPFSYHLRNKNSASLILSVVCAYLLFLYAVSFSSFVFIILLAKPWCLGVCHLWIGCRSLRIRVHTTHTPKLHTIWENVFCFGIFRANSLCFIVVVIVFLCISLSLNMMFVCTMSHFSRSRISTTNTNKISVNYFYEMHHSYSQWHCLFMDFVKLNMNLCTRTI